MPEVELFVALLAVVVLAALVAERLRHLPSPVALVLGGLAAGLLPVAPEVEIDPEVIFLVFLPPILYPSAFRFAAEDVRADVRPIAFLAIGLVLATTAAIAAVAHFLAGIPWGAAFVLGAILSPTDPVAATSVIRAAGAPMRIATILEGESLINDATALTALRIAIGSVGAAFSLGSAAGDFVLVALGGAAIGAALGLAVSFLRARMDHLELESALAVLLAYGSFMLAEQLHVSGILATVAAGWIMGHRAHAVMSPASRIGGASFWSVAQFLAESILFLLIGLAFAQVLDDPATRTALELAGITAAVVATAVAMRFLWMFGEPHVAALVSPRERIILAWGGLRGAVSVAAALTVPATAAGAGFPERNTLIVVALASIVALLVLPALTLPRLLRAAGLLGDEDMQQRERDARVALAEAALTSIEDMPDDQVAPDVRERAREPYEARAIHYGPDTGDGRATALRQVRRAAIAGQRRRLHEMREAGEVSGDLLRSLERDLDLEEERAR